MESVVSAGRHIVILLSNVSLFPCGIRVKNQIIISAICELYSNKQAHALKHVICLYFID